MQIILNHAREIGIKAYPAMCWLWVVNSDFRVQYAWQQKQRYMWVQD